MKDFVVERGLFSDGCAKPVDSEAGIVDRCIAAACNTLARLPAHCEQAIGEFQAFADREPDPRRAEAYLAGVRLMREQYTKVRGLLEADGVRGARRYTPTPWQRISRALFPPKPEDRLLEAHQARTAILVAARDAYQRAHRDQEVAALDEMIRQEQQLLARCGAEGRTL